MNPATPNDPEAAADPAAPKPVPSAPKPPPPHGAPIPQKFASYGGGKPGGGSKFFQSHQQNARPHIPPAAMRGQRHGRHDG